MLDTINKTWSGNLTPENAEEVARVMTEILEGKTFVTVNVNEGLQFRPEVRTGQRLDHNTRGGRAISAQVRDDRSSAIILMNDTYGTLPISVLIPEEGSPPDKGD